MKQTPTILDATKKSVGGRPLGSVETPATQLKRELKDTIMLMRRVREMAARQLRALEKELDKGVDMSVDARLSIIKAFAEITDTMSGSMRAAVTYLKAADGVADGERAGGAATDEEVDRILDKEIL